VTSIDNGGTGDVGSVRAKGRWTVVVPHDELDPSTSPPLRTQLENLHQDGSVHLAVDWRGVTFFDSSAIGVLMGIHTLLRDAGGQLVVICESGRSRRLFDLMALDQVFTFADSDEELT